MAGTQGQAGYFTNLDVEGNGSISGNLTVGGTFTPPGTQGFTNLTVSGTLVVSGVTTHNGIVNMAAALRLATPAGVAQTASQLWAGSGAPNDTNGANGDFYFRSDGGTGTWLYNRASGTWTGIL